MNILFISNDPSIFEPESSTRNRMRAYAKEIGTLHIISPGNGPKRDVEREDLPDGAALILHMVTGKRFGKLLKMQKCATKLLQSEPIELVSAQDPFEYGWIALKAVSEAKRPVKLHVQLHTDAFSPWFTRGNITYISHLSMPLMTCVNTVRQWLADRVLPEADGIRVVSKRILDSLTYRYGDRIVSPSLIPIAVSSEVPPKESLPPHAFTFTLITVGRLEPEKRMQDILHALARIHINYPSVGLVVIGDGSLRKKLEVEARKLGLSNHVVFLGARPDAMSLMQDAQAYIQASAYEGYGRTLIEAALARIPIITTDVGIVGEVFKGYEEVLSAPPGDPSALATHIRGLLEDFQARKEFVLSAEKAAREHLASVHTSPADIAQDLRAVIQKTA